MGVGVDEEDGLVEMDMEERRDARAVARRMSCGVVRGRMVG